ncbi:MAG TPA: hypothetical protein QGF05_13430 [Dehalococcoidia bacterium]|nr:hypothetical protein [Dehalococcoidia bacterium]
MLRLALTFGLFVIAFVAADASAQSPTLIISEVLVNSGEGSRDASFE